MEVAAFLAVVSIVLLFGMVITVGAPYVPVLSRPKQLALDMLALQPGERLLELGSGDGRVLRAAAARGIKVVGIEINPLLVLVSYIVTWRYRRNVTIIWGNMWTRQWPECDGVFTFLLDRYMARLDSRVAAWARGRQVRLASYGFPLPNKTPIAAKEAVFMYEYR